MFEILLLAIVLYAACFWLVAAFFVLSVRWGSRRYAATGGSQPEVPAAVFLFDDLLGLALAVAFLVPLAGLVIWWTAEHFSWWWMHAAAFRRAKRLPSLKTVLRRLEEPASRGRRTQTREQQIALLDGLGTTLGGAASEVSAAVKA